MNNFLKYLYLIICVNLCIATSLWGQDKRFIQMNVDHGLSQNSVVDMVQDSFGIIWMATQDGLNRYDGQDFEYIRKYFDDITRPNFSRLGKIYVDKKNQLWIITENAVLERSDKDRGYLEIDSVNNASCIIQFGDNYLVGSFGEGLYLIDAIGKLIMHNPLKKSTTVFNIVESNDHVFLCTNNGLISINPNNLEIEKTHFPSLNVSKIVMHKDQYYIATYGQGLWKSDQNFSKLFQEITDLNIEDIHIDGNQNIWMATYGDGLWCRVYEESSWEQLKNNPANLNSINYDDLLDIMEDDQGNIWIGSDGGGISIYSKSYNKFKSITNYNTPKAISVDVPRAIAVDEEYNIWIGTSGKGLTYYNSIERTFQSYNTYLSDLRIMSLQEDRGYMWVGTQESGLIKVNKESKIAEPVQALQNKPIWDITKLNDNELLLASSLPELIIFNTTTYELKYIPLPPDISFPRVAYANGKNIYIGCNKGQILRWHTETDSVDILLNSINNENGSIKSLNYINDLLWIGTQKNGLLAMDQEGQKILHMTSTTGLTNNTVYAIMQGSEEHELWLATNNGIVEINYTNNKIEVVSKYSVDNGLPSNEFNTGAYYKTNDGTIYLGALNGVIWFDPEDLGEIIEKDKVVIESISYHVKKGEIIRTNILNHNEVEVLHGIRDFQLHFSKPGLSITEPLFDYKLTPYHPDWITNGNTATFSNIAAGDYQLELRLTKNHEAVDKIRIVISKYWYERTWVKIIAFLLLIGSLVTVFRVYSARLILRGQLDKQRALSERNKDIIIAQNTFFANVTHEFRTPLTVISGLVNQLKISSEKKEIVQKNSNNLLELVNKMMEYSKVESGMEVMQNEKIRLYDFLKYLVSSFDSLAAQKGIRLHYDLRDELVFVMVDRRKLKSAIGNIVANAIQYCKAQDEICVAYEIENECCIIRIQDTGPGIPAEYRDKIFDRYVRVNENVDMGTGLGLAIAKKYVELMGGSISLQSLEGEGSMFSIRLPNIFYGDSLSIQNNGIYHSILIDDQDKPIVLVVEDNTDMQHYLKSILSTNYHVLMACNGIEGKKMAVQYTPDLIISDAMMPEMDGITMIQHLKKMIETSHIPVIILTAKITQEDREAGLSSGAISYIVKPFHEDELMSIMESIFRDRDRVIKYFENNQQLPYDRVVEVEFVSIVRKIIRENLSNDQFNVQSIAEQLHLDRSQIYRKLKSLTGQTPKRMIRVERINKAKKMMHNGQMTVTEIAYACGFSDPSYFSKVFKSQTGQTPTEYSLQ